MPRELLNDGLDTIADHSAADHPPGPYDRDSSADDVDDPLAATEIAMANSEAEYLMARAREEAGLATHAQHPSAAAAHQSLSVLYSAKAVIELADNTVAPGPGKEICRPKKEI